MDKKNIEENHQREDYKENPLKVVFKKSIKKNKKAEQKHPQKSKNVSAPSKKAHLNPEASAGEKLARFEDAQPLMSRPVFSDPKQIYLIYGDFLVPELALFSAGPQQSVPQNQNTVVRMLSQFNKFKHVTNVSLEKTSDFVVVSLEDNGDRLSGYPQGIDWKGICEKLLSSENSEAVELARNIREYCESVETSSNLQIPSASSLEEEEIERKGRELRESLSEQVALLITTTKKEGQSHLKVTELSISRKLQEIICEDVETLPALISNLGLPDIVVLPNPLATLNTILAYYLRKKGVEFSTELALNTEEGRTLRIKTQISSSSSIRRNDLILTFLIDESESESLRAWRNSRKKEDRIRDLAQTTMKIESESPLNEWEKLITSYYPKVQVDLPVVVNSEKVCKYRQIKK